MKKFRFLHIADLHADSDAVKRDKFEKSATQIIDYCKANKVNAVIIAGDVFDRKQSFAFNTGVPAVQCFLGLLAEDVDHIFIVKGNNAHDEPGSVHLLDQLQPNIHAFEQPAVMAVSGGKTANLLRGESDFEPEYIVSLMPYPTKAAILKDAGIDDNNEAFVEVFTNILSSIGDIHDQYNCPKILGFHGNVQGSRLSTGQTLVSQDLMVAPFTLYQAKADYYALGHIHMPQMVAPSMYYSGSLYNCNWGETEQKSFNVVEFCEESYDNFLREEPYKPKVEIIPLVSARPMITLDMDFHESAVEMIMSNRQNLSTSEIDAITNSKAEIRLKIKIKENDRKLLTDTYIEELKNSWGEDVKIDWNIIPSERESRSENIMNCKSLTDEVKEYASVVNEEVTDSMIEKILKIQGREVAA